MHRFFIKKKFIDNKFYPSQDLLHQMRNVLKFTEKDQFLIVYNGEEYLSFLNSKNEIVILKLLDKKNSWKKDNPKIILIQAMLKNSKMPIVLQKATELGVDEIILLETFRSIVKYKNLENKYERFKKILIEASEQSDLLKYPKLKILKTYRDISFDKEKDLKFLFFEKEKKQYLFNFDFNNQINSYENIYLFIGPEGGFDLAEVNNLILKYGFISMGLNFNILRSETAAISALSIVINELYRQRSFSK